MASNRLRNNVNNTSIEVALCDWHLRKVFWDKRLLPRVKSGEFAIKLGPIRPRKYPTVSSPAPYNQEFVIYDVASNEEIARCHQLLEADRVTLAGSKKPDPKQIRIGS